MADPINQETASAVVPSPAPATPAPQAPVEAPVATPVAPTPQPAVAPSTPAPSEADRTREQFEKLLDSNQKLYQANDLLRQELSQRLQANQQFAPVQPVPQAQPVAQQQYAQQYQQPVDPRDFIEVDSDGQRFINEQKLRARVQELENATQRATNTVTQYIQTAEQREAQRQNQEAFGAYPELNPASPQFNVGFHNQVRAQIYDSLINPQDYKGRPLSFKEAGDFVKSQIFQPQATMAQPTPVVEQAQEPDKAAAQAAAQAEALKQQSAAGLVGQGQPELRTQQVDDADLEQLRLATRKGDINALARRLAAFGGKEDNAS